MPLKWNTTMRKAQTRVEVQVQRPATTIYNLQQCASSWSITHCCAKSSTSKFWDRWVRNDQGQGPSSRHEWNIRRSRPMQRERQRLGVYILNYFWPIFRSKQHQKSMMARSVAVFLAVPDNSDVIVATQTPIDQPPYVHHRMTATPGNLHQLYKARSSTEGWRWWRIMESCIICMSNRMSSWNSREQDYQFRHARCYGTTFELTQYTCRMTSLTRGNKSTSVI